MRVLAKMFAVQSSVLFFGHIFYFFGGIVTRVITHFVGIVIFVLKPVILNIRLISLVFLR